MGGDAVRLALAPHKVDMVDFVDVVDFVKECAPPSHGNLYLSDCGRIARNSKPLNTLSIAICGLLPILLSRMARKSSDL